MVWLDLGTENIDGSVLDLVMFWLKMPVLVATNTAGDVLTSCKIIWVLLPQM